MADEIENVSGTNMDQIKIALNSLYLCIDYALKHISLNEGPAAAAECKARMLEKLKNGDINMALLEETKTFELVVGKIEALALPETEDAPAR